MVAERTGEPEPGQRDAGLTGERRRKQPGDLELKEQPVTPRRGRSGALDAAVGWILLACSKVQLVDRSGHDLDVAQDIIGGDAARH